MRGRATESNFNTWKSNSVNFCVWSSSFVTPQTLVTSFRFDIHSFGLTTLAFFLKRPVGLEHGFFPFLAPWWNGLWRFGIQPRELLTYQLGIGDKSSGSQINLWRIQLAIIFFFSTVEHGKEEYCKQFGQGLSVSKKSFLPAEPEVLVTTVTHSLFLQHQQWDCLPSRGDLAYPHNSTHIYLLVGGFKYLLFSIIYGMSSFPLTTSYFSEG